MPVKNGPTVLTPQQERFVYEYLIDLKAKGAAIRAGYSKKTAGEMGYELLKRPHIAEKVAAGLAERGERTGVDAAYVLEVIMKVIRERSGTGKHANPNAVLKGIELLGRHLAMFTDKAVVDVNHGLQEMSDDELEAHARRLAEKVGGTLPLRLITPTGGDR